MSNLRRAARLAGSFALGWTFCAAGPPRVGTEVQGGGGAGRYDFASGGCDRPRYVHQVREIPIHGRVTHRRAGGLTMAAEGAASFGTVHTATLDQEAPTTAPAEYAVGDRRDLGYVAARVGYAGRWAGGSAGPSLLFEAHDHAHPFVSAEGWLGLPRLAYAFGELIAGPLSGARLPIAAGIGHADDRIRVEVAIGAANSARQHEDHVAAFSMAVDLMVTERLSLGAFAALNEREGSVGLVRAGWWIAP